MKPENNTAQEKLVFIQIKNESFAGLPYQRKLTTLYYYKTRIDFASCINIWCVYIFNYDKFLKNYIPNALIHESWTMTSLNSEDFRGFNSREKSYQ